LSDEANKANKAGKAVGVAATSNKLDELDEAHKANVANKADKFNKAIEVNVADRGNSARKANKASLTKTNKLLANQDDAVFVIKYSSKLLLLDSNATDVFLYFIFSLTKYSADLAEVKEYFGINGIDS
jgi:hypothetical protein